MKLSPSGEFNWPTGLFILGYHAGLLVGLPFYFYYARPSAALIAISVALLFLTEIGIGAAYHRYYSHRAYTLSKPAEAVLLFFGTLAFQGSALRWSYDHRLHHSFVDTDDDPYSIKKGFWYAHVLWLFTKARPLDERWVADVKKNKLVMFQDRWSGTLSTGSNLLVCGLVGWGLGDFLGALVLTWWTRLLLSHHLTWFVNSLAHCWGARTYSKEQSAVDNYVLAFLTVGEGYHNYHHTFASDYRNGVRWYHFDPTKWTIWTLSRFGLASDLKRYDAHRIDQRLVREDRRLLLATLTRKAHEKRAELEQRIEQLASRLLEKLNRRAALAQQIRALRARRAERTALRRARRQLKAVRRSLRRDFEAWNQLCGLVLEPAPAA